MTLISALSLFRSSIAEWKVLKVDKSANELSGQGREFLRPKNHSSLQCMVMLKLAKAIIEGGGSFGDQLQEDLKYTDRLIVGTCCV